MFIHEYQAKSLLNRSQILIPKGKVITTINDAASVMNTLPFKNYVIKAQIHGGGRGKAGGILIVDSKEEALEDVKTILGKRLVTTQTGPSGRIVRNALIEEKVNIQKEIYVSLTIDREKACPIVIVSPEGGIEIEKVNFFFEEGITSPMGLYPFQKRRLTYNLGLRESSDEFASLIEKLYRLFIKYDMTLLEINPLAIDKMGRLVALDAKMSFDDNGLFRQKEISDLYDPGELDPLEAEAQKESLNYVRMDGDIGCLVNGAGLAMATIDLIDFYGGKVTNFLDVGGGASSEKIEKAVRILLEDKRMKVMLINIFGGILRCDRFAEGLVNASGNKEIKIPIIIRFKGTMIEEGKRIIRDSGLNLIWADSMEEAASIAVIRVNTDQ
ncbi:MAG: ADP-forming succinate--CoA ligase subunit beta [Nitrospirae bacterium]|nr:ADP-forming succinate--CoA ligase subunit beta [Nitrospirota bacterium]